MTTKARFNLPNIKEMFAAHDMTEGKPWKNLLSFTIPMLIGSIVQQLYSTVDAIVVGRFESDSALAAIGSTTSIFFLLLVFFIGISSGAGIMVSQYFGAKKREELSHTIGTCLVLLTVISIVVMIAAPLGTRPLLRLLRTPETIIDMSVTYINILLYGTIGIAYYNILTGIIRGLGDSFSPFVYLVIASILNIALDLLFVAVFGWGVAGAAIATVICNVISGVLCLMRLLKMRDVINIGAKYFKPKKEYMLKITTLGMPTGASQAVFSLSMILIQWIINSFGENFIASNIIVMRIDGFAIMSVFSFGTAIMVFTGQNIGAGKMDRVKQGTKECLWMSVGTSGLIVLGIVLFGEPLAGLFTNTREIIDLSARILKILSAGYLFLAFGQVYWSVIRGAGDTVTPMWCIIIAVVLIRVPLAYLSVYIFEEPESIYYATLVSWSISGIMSYVVYRMGRWKNKSLVKKDNAVVVEPG